MDASVVGWMGSVSAVCGAGAAGVYVEVSIETEADDEAMDRDDGDRNGEVSVDGTTADETLDDEDDAGEDDVDDE